MITGSIIAIVSLSIGLIVGYLVSNKNIRTIEDLQTNIIKSESEIKMLNTIMRLEAELNEHKNKVIEDSTKRIDDAFRNPKTGLLTYKKVVVKDDE